MQELTSVERIARQLKRQPVDRIGTGENFWVDTQKRWAKEGHIAEGESLLEHFHLDIQECAPGDVAARLDWEVEVLEETEETILTRDRNGAVLRRHKLHDGTPEHVDYLVKDHAAWEEHIKPYLRAERRRVFFDAYRDARAYAQSQDRFFAMSGVLPFELMHFLVGHENLLMSMATDPEWIKDMVSTYIEMLINMSEMLFDEVGLPDGVWYYEDLGFKGRPFMSPRMYRELLMPGHKRIMDFCHARGLPVILHSCGFVEPLLPDLLEAGVDCLQAIETKAGMDLAALSKTYGKRLSFMGGMDVRVLCSNDLGRVEAELAAKLPSAKANNGYILHSDHSIPDQVEYKTYKFFLERGRELGRYD